ncbi:hypothetical protein QFC19_008463 [Naganishia cerealis]|uniref:Uncharacterized protein n=1 Tax=Naganishia cerealis TaxID=610337 RepID=A0ACC2V2G0_9TREE|nr:hypothetical protein QFC19_008463 [Naganishia cerealis]
MSHNVKLNFQPLPNLPYVQGYPGIIGSPYRKPPAVQGLLEVRVGKDQIKAKQIQIEFIQVEHLPGSRSVRYSAQVVASPIGSPINVWSASNGAEWEYASNADYKVSHIKRSKLDRVLTINIIFQFYIPLPLNLPGSVELKQKGGAIRYELQANFHHKPKSGLLRKESTPITQVIKPIYIGKMELLAAWPIYNIPEVRQTMFEEMELVVSRPYTAFGPGDRIEVHATLRSLRPKPLKVRAFILTLHEFLTIRLPTQKGAKQNAIHRGKVVHETKINVNEKIARSEEIQRTIPLIVPPGLVANTIRNGRAIELQYELSVKAIMEGMGDPKIEHLTCIVGTVPRARAHDIVNTFAASSAGMNPAGMQYGVPGSIYQSPASTTPPALQNRNSYYGNALYANPSTVDLTPVRSRPQSSFVSRPLSADASSLYSHRQSQSEISSLRDPRAEYFPGTRPNERPQSYATFGQSSSEFLNPHVDSRRMTYFGPAGHQQLPQTTRSSLSVDRPEGPIRMDSYNSQVASIRSREGQELIPAQTSAKPRWAAAESEKQRLYVEARRRAALTQLAGGGELASMGLDEPPAEEPPSYSPRDPVIPQENNAPASITVTSPTAQNPSIPPGEPYTSTLQLRTSGHLITSPDPSNGVGLGIRNAQNFSRGDASRAGSSQSHHSTSVNEKERMRMFFEQRDRQDISSRPSASNLSHTSASSSVMAAPPSTAEGARSGDFLSAENEKDIMRRRYEAAARAVSHANTGSVSSRGSFQDHSPKRSPTSSTFDHSRSQSSHVAYQTTENDNQLRNELDQVTKATASLHVDIEPTQSYTYHPSTEEEKNMMRRRYEEAMAATAHETSPSSTSTVPGPSRRNHVTPNSQEPVSQPELQSVDTTFANKSSISQGSGYMTASQEKEQMRQRYETAMQATRQVHRSQSSASNTNDSGVFTHPRAERQQTTWSDPNVAEPPPLPAKPPEIEQYKAILSSPTQEMAYPMYINNGMVPMYPMVYNYPSGVPGMDYSQMMNGYFPQRGGPYQMQ